MGEASARLSFASPDGLTLIGDVSGDGDVTIALLHGGGQSRHAWSRFAPLLVAAGYRVLRSDMRGHGDSAWAADGNYYLPALAADLSAFIAGAGPLGRVVLVGASVGGLAGLHAIALGLDVAALVLIDTAIRPSPVGTERLRRFMAAHLSGFGTLDQAAHAIEAFRGRRPRSVDDLRRSFRHHADGRWHWRWDPRFLSQADALEERSALLGAGAANVRVPVLLLRGGDSDVVDDSAVAEMTNLLPCFEAVTVPGASHTITGDDQDAYGAVLLKRLPALLG